MLNMVDVLCDEYKLFINFSNDPFRILRLVISIYKCTTFLSVFKQGPINVSRVTIPGSYDFLSLMVILTVHNQSIQVLVTNRKESC